MKFKIRILLLIFCLACTGYAVITYIGSAPVNMQTSEIFIPDGSSIRDAAVQLKKEDLIRNKNYFILLTYLSPYSTIKQGNYKIYAGSSSYQILKKIASGKVLTQKITIPEGFNLFQIADRLDEYTICPSSAFLTYAHDTSFLRSLEIHAPSIEGYLFPDTYLFHENSDPRDVMNIMYQKMLNVLDSFATETQTSGLNRHHILILASLIEEETQIASERPYVSSVFHNRLRKNMRFDSDPTVRYAVKKFSGRLRYKDLRSSSPFNTYMHRGYPPTPIASPGKASISAALQPAESNFLFFVARNDGSHYFSTTLRVHNRAVEYYQKGIKNGFIDKQKL